MYRPGDTLYYELATHHPSTKAAANADSLPTVVLLRNGAASGQAVSVASVGTGLYRASAAIPADWSAGDSLQLRITATVAGVTANRHSEAWPLVTAQQIRDALKLAPSAGEPADGSIDKHLDMIQAKTDQISVSAPMLIGGATVGAAEQTTIRGDSYTAHGGNPIHFDLPTSEYGDLSGAQVRLTVKHQSTKAVQLKLSGTVESPNSEDQALSFDLSAADSAAMAATGAPPARLPAGIAYAPGRYGHVFDAEAFMPGTGGDPDTVRTKLIGYWYVIEDVTTPADRT